MSERIAGRIVPGQGKAEPKPAKVRRHIDWLNLSPLAYVAERVSGDGPPGPNGEPRPRHDYSPAARLIAVMIVKRCNPEGEAFMSLADIAARSGYSLKTVWRVGGAEVWDGPGALFQRTFRKTRNGHCGQFKLIRNPDHHTPAREAKRKRKRQRVERVLGRPGARVPLSEAELAARDELSRRKLELQRHKLAGELSPADYDRKVAELERPHLKPVGGKLR